MSNRRKPKPQPVPTALPESWSDQPPAAYPTRITEFIRRSSDGPRFNVWRCERCHTDVLCVDRHPGVTPFTVSHRALGDPDCPGLCVSAFYAVPQSGEPTMEWYRPSAAELSTESPEVRAHVAQGGLLVRPVQP